MKSKFFLAFLCFAGALTLTPSSYADIAFDFDSTQPVFDFTFSDGGNLAIATTFDGGGNPGEGYEVEVTGVTGAPAFAGVGIGNIDLAGELGVTPGSFTEADFDNLLLSFDYVVSPGLVLNSTRLDVAGFGLRLEFPADLTSGVWDTVSFTIGDSIQLTEFVGALNANPANNVTFQLSLSQGVDGIYEVGDRANIDNFSLSFAAIPEPSAAMFGMFAMSFAAIRRSRRS